MQQKTHLVLTQYRKGSAYADLVGSRYHFPKKYFNFLTRSDIEFIYYEPVKAGGGVYFGYGEVGEVTPDPGNTEQFYAELLNYHKFKQDVSRLSEDSGKMWESGAFYNPQNAVRRIDAETFTAICAKGGIELGSLGVEPDSFESDEENAEPFDPSLIKVERETMSVFQVLRKIDLGEVVLTPDFQRNMVWDPVRRSRLIESVLLRIPLPAFYFDGVDVDNWVVVDGLQRLSTLRDFITLKTLRLQGLEYLKVDEKGFDDLPRGMQRDLEETQITLFIIRPETPPEVKFTIFYRINTGGLVLTAQEIRHALFQGKATQLLKELASSKEFEKATGGSVSDVRMDARECVLRYLAFRLHPYQEYSKADLNKFLSKAMADLNNYAPDRIKVLASDFRDAMKRASEILGPVAFRKFSLTSDRRRPINKALFETWSNVLQSYQLDRLRQHREDILWALGTMLSEDPEYVRSLSAGTGGVGAVHTRFERAHRAVAGVLR